MVQPASRMDQIIFARLVLLQADTTAAAPAATPHLDPWKLIVEASFVVQLVMILLVVMGLVCFFIMGAKLVRLMVYRSQPRCLCMRSERRRGRLDHRAPRRPLRACSFEGSPLAAVFKAGYVEPSRA
ncbi:MAG: hypothetical protein R3B99_11035 [Polyangiales bacterium]